MAYQWFKLLKMDEKLFDIKYWLPLNGGEYHCTIAVGVTQEYVDKVTVEYNKGLELWRNAPSAWRLPFYHTMKVVDHSFMPRNLSFQKSSEHDKAIRKAKEDGIEEGKRQIVQVIPFYITDQRRLTDFKKNYSKFFK